MTEDSAGFARQRKNGFKTNAKLTFGSNIFVPVKPTA